MPSGSLPRVEIEFRSLAPKKPDQEIQIAARTPWAGIHGISIAGLTSTPGGQELRYVVADGGIIDP